MLNKVISTGSLKAHGVVAFFPANSVGDDIEVYGENGEVLETLYGLRQQVYLITSTGEVVFPTCIDVFDSPVL